jgi:hypothetical protein
MRVRVEADGSMEFEISSDGDAAAAAELVRRLRDSADAGTAPTPAARNAAAMTPAQSATYSLLRRYPDGCHYTAAAAELGLSDAAANSRLWYLSQLGYAERIRGGVYRALG